MDDVCEGKDFSFPQEEVKVLHWWDEVHPFKTQLEKTKDFPEYIFYDGPPFATGLPHYGHILAGTIKDIVTRYQTMTGHHVTRRFGWESWDCHGLAVEHEIDKKKLGIKSREDVMKMLIDKYNEECRSIVTRYVGEWEKVITRTGRGIDFKNDYKTMDLNFMEWKACGGCLNNYLRRALFTEDLRLCRIALVARLHYPILRLIQTTRKCLILK